jgi:serine/threonine protein kinase
MSIGHTNFPSTMPEIGVGNILAGKYRVDKILGRGGMGIVVAATHLELETSVAIKLLLPEVRGNQEVVTRFAREARAAAQIKSEYVARTLDVGKLDSGCPYIVMEYLEGADLSQRLAQQGPLPIPEAIRLILQACDALAEAHALGIIHRDLKPSNLFVTRRRDGTEVAKMLDFGISKLSPTGGTGPDLSMTRTTSVMGSPLYMSPEQLVSSRNVDPRSDIWALGVTLYEALAGLPPFGGETLPELITRVMTQPAPPLSSLRPDAPAQLEAVIMRCLAKEPAARYQSVGELAAALLPFAPASTTGVGQQALAEASKLATLGMTATDSPAPQLSGTVPLVVPTVNSWGQTNEEQIPKQSMWIPMLVAIVGVIAVAGGLVVWRIRGSDPTTTPLSGAAAAVTSESRGAVASAAQQAVGVSSTVTPVASSATSQAAAAASVTVNLVSPIPSLALAVTHPAASKPGPTDRRFTAANLKPTKTPPAAPRPRGDLFGDRN